MKELIDTGMLSNPHNSYESCINLNEIERTFWEVAEIPMDIKRGMYIKRGVFVKDES